MKSSYHIVSLMKVCRLIQNNIYSNIYPGDVANHYCLNDTIESEFGLKLRHFDALISILHVFGDAFL